MESTMDDVVATLSVKETAKVLGISTYMVRQAIDEGKLAVLKFGSGTRGQRWRIPRIAIERLLEGRAA